MSIASIQAGALAGAEKVRHGFFTRRGGVSGGIYASLNCGYGSDDKPEAVRENRARVAQAMDVDDSAVLTVHQVHSSQAVTVATSWSPDAAPRADAMATNRPGLALSILTADCAPVLLADADAGVVGAAHAGWRGALHGVLEAVVRAMQALGAEPRRIAAAVGPCIAQPSYEVGAEFEATFVIMAKDNRRYFQPADRTGHYRFDLPGYVQDRLRAGGLGAVELLGRDTYADPEDFFSYRRATHQGEPDYGRQISSIAIAR